MAAPARFILTARRLPRRPPEPAPILVDGGFRRGTDVFKALALGANAVGIGRPYIWGLAAHGQQRAERVLDILNNELRLAMIGCGARTVRDITAAALIDRGKL